IEPYGDRQNELVLIGQRMDRETVEQSLDACLLTEKEMAEPWDSFSDPLPGNGQLVTYSD
ncbi:MAG: GTP-binding protein, partial [Exiguobacterium marinum]|uniref:GTP-binding protein n=1 Tax=Exiguobacterium marinum TaxID=273528 RepID=UPI003C4952E2